MSAPTADDGPARRRPRRGVVLAAVVLVALAAAGVAAALVLRNDDGDDDDAAATTTTTTATATTAAPKKRTLTAKLVTGFIVIEGAKVTAAGTVNAKPGGQGAAVVTLFPQGDLRKGKPVKMTGSVVFYMDGGRIDSALSGTATPGPQNTFSVKGTAKISGGTGLYDDAKGSFNFEGGQEAGAIVGRPAVDGTITY
jgi:opacity protein-like surface antigen